jgi:hypothetical protein
MLAKAPDSVAVEIGNILKRSAVEAGRLLLQKKKEIGHGGWVKWLAVNREYLGFGDGSVLTQCRRMIPA